MSAAGLGRSPGWYARRLRRFQRGELRWRVADAVGRRRWHAGFDGLVLPEPPGGAAPVSSAGTVVAGDGSAWAASPSADRSRERLLAAADDLLGGDFTVLGVTRRDLAVPDWRSDGRTVGRSDLSGGSAAAAPSGPALKDVWELSRHHVLTVLGTAWALTSDHRHLVRADELLASWLATNADPRRSVHWSNVEIAQRLVSWAWLRRLAAGDPLIEARFAAEPTRRLLFAHLDWLARFPSRFSSANNHRVAEAAGLLVGACAFADLVPTHHLPHRAMRILDDALDTQVSPSGLQREPAVDYHCFVLDLCLVAFAEARCAGLALRSESVQRLGSMADALAAISDTQCRGPRFGDSDESQVAQMDVGVDVVARTLSLAAAVCGPSDGWPDAPHTFRADAVAALAGGSLRSRRGPRPPGIEGTDGYVAIAASPRPDGCGAAGWWAAMRVGDFSYLPIGSHSHADLLTVELRLDGIDVLVDPGTYVYGALPGWRRRMRSTAAHPTLCLDDSDQVEYWGPFLWGGDAQAVARVIDRDGGGRPTAWEAAHDAYRRLAHPATVTRRLEVGPGRVVLTDRVEGEGPWSASLLLPLGPECEVVGLEPGDITASPDGVTRVRLEVGGRQVDLGFDGPLRWRLVPTGRPPEGVVSFRFGELAPVPALVGAGRLSPGDAVVSTFDAAPVGEGEVVGEGEEPRTDPLGPRLRRPRGTSMQA